MNIWRTWFILFTILFGLGLLTGEPDVLTLISISTIIPTILIGIAAIVYRIFRFITSKIGVTLPKPKLSQKPQKSVETHTQEKTRRKKSYSAREQTELTIRYVSYEPKLNIEAIHRALAENKRRKAKIKVTSFRFPEKHYEIDLCNLTCSCPDFQERRGKYPTNNIRRLCKHLVRVLSYRIVTWEMWDFTDDFAVIEIGYTAKKKQGIYINRKTVKGYYETPHHVVEYVAMVKLEKKRPSVDFLYQITSKRTGVVRNGYAIYGIDSEIWYPENPFPRGTKSQMTREAKRIYAKLKS